MFYQIVGQSHRYRSLKITTSMFACPLPTHFHWFYNFKINSNFDKINCFRCPKNFMPVHRSYDQDSDADLWRETNIFGRRTTRYLCLSKSEGLPEYIVDTLKWVNCFVLFLLFIVVAVCGCFCCNQNKFSGFPFDATISL